MTSKDSILAAIRRHQVPAAPLPELDGPWITYDDPLAAFTASVEAVGGQVARVGNRDELAERLQVLPAWNAAQTICNTVPGVDLGNFDLDACADPHQLEHIDLAVVEGQFAVAENGAVWVTDEHLRHRVVLFIAQHLALVTPADQVVDNLHQAYQRLAWGERGFGVLISGPSKTADIEQSLVIGAHGARSLTVFLLDDAS